MGAMMAYTSGYWDDDDDKKEKMARAMRFFFLSPLTNIGWEAMMWAFVDKGEDRVSPNVKSILPTSGAILK